MQWLSEDSDDLLSFLKGKEVKFQVVDIPATVLSVIVGWTIPMQGETWTWGRDVATMATSENLSFNDLSR